MQYQNLALQLKGRVADTKTGCLFRERLKELNLAEALFARFHELKSNIPACIEYVFGGQAAIGGPIVRTIGLKRARVKIGITNLVYSIRRLGQLLPQAFTSATA